MSAIHRLDYLPKIPLQPGKLARCVCVCVCVCARARVSELVSVFVYVHLRVCDFVRVCICVCVHKFACGWWFFYASTFFLYSVSDTEHKKNSFPSDINTRAKTRACPSGKHKVKPKKKRNNRREAWEENKLELGALYQIEENRVFLLREM